jgi:hypothetical protein
MTIPASRSRVTWPAAFRWLRCLWTPLLTLFVLGTWWLGAAGFARAGREGSTTLDHAYHALQLFALEHAEIATPSAPIQLQIARLLAPLVAALALSSVALRLYHGARTGWTSLRVRCRRNHVVVAGLGRMGTSLALRFAEQGLPVVAIERDEAMPGVELARAQGIPVVIGDARVVGTLRAAGLDRARWVVAICGTTGANIEILANCLESVPRDLATPLNLLVHVTDPDLHCLLQERLMSGPASDGIRLATFHLHDRGAQLLLDRCLPAINHNLPFGDDGRTQGQVPRFFVLGSGPMSLSLMHWFARDYAVRRRNDNERLEIVVFGEDANEGELAFRLEQRFPGWRAVLTIDHRPQQATPWACQAALSAELLAPERPMHGVLVAASSDELSLTLALAAARALADTATPIVAVVRENEGLARLVGAHADQEGKRRFPNLHLFTLREAVCHPEILSVGDVMAREIHERYLRFRRQESQSSMTDDPACAPWDELDEAFRESCRDQAHAISAHLEAIGAELEIDGATTASIELNADEVETLARSEHERWLRERRARGWRYSERKDKAAKVTPDLVEWESLSEEARRLNRNMMRVLPAVVERAGYAIRRRSPSSLAARPVLRLSPESGP